MSLKIDRRHFLQGGLAGAVMLAGGPVLTDEKQKKVKLKKAVKYDMIKIKGSIEDKFNLIKSLGFLGVEVDSPSNIDKRELVKARDKTGIAIHGVIDSIHWNVRLSDPDAKVRARGLKALQNALADAKLYGADTVLLVPGQVTNKKTENFDQVWTRSQAEVRKAMPLAKKLGVRIAIEVVWNDFITKPDQLVK
jgi:hexulose-6-phosphate isomerase